MGKNCIFSTISFDLHIRILKSTAFLESTGNFRSKEYPQAYTTRIFYVFDGGRGSLFCGFRIFCVSRHKKKLLNISHPATFLKMFLKVYIMHFCNKIPSSIDVRVPLDGTLTIMSYVFYEWLKVGINHCGAEIFLRCSKNR